MSIYSSYDRKYKTSFKLSEELNEETIDIFWKSLPLIIDIKLNNKDINDLFEKIKNIDCNTLNCDCCEICYKYETKVTFNNEDIDRTKENIKLIIDFINKPE
jgi:hypothetical protein